MKFPPFTLVPQLDRSPQWVAFAQTLPGKLMMVTSFAGLLFLHDTTFWWLISLYLLAFSLWPQHRWQILLASTWSFLLVGPTDFHWGRINLLFSAADIPWQCHLQEKDAQDCAQLDEPDHGLADARASLPPSCAHLNTSSPGSGGRGGY